MASSKSHRKPKQELMDSEASPLDGDIDHDSTLVSGLLLPAAGAGLAGQLNLQYAVMDDSDLSGTPSDRHISGCTLVALSDFTHYRRWACNCNFVDGALVVVEIICKQRQGKAPASGL